MRERLTKIILCCSLVALALAAATGRAAAESSIPLEVYRRNVTEAATRLEELASLYVEVEANTKYERWSNVSPENDPARRIFSTQQSAFGEARRLLPPAQTVKLEDGATLAVSNAWLHTALDDYEQKFGSGSNTDRARRVRDIVERLRAVGARLGEYAGASQGAAARDKEAEKGRLATILRGPDFNKQAAKGGAITDLLERIQKWLESLFERSGPRRGPGTGVATAAQLIIFGLAFGVFAFVLWRFWRTRRGSLSRVTLRREPRVILGETIAPDERPSDLLSDAERLARAGDLRGAIRKAYVALLLELGDRNVLRLARHKTNREYLYAVRQHAPPLYPFMRPLTLSFERYWYGYERATEDDWRDFLTNCRRTLDVK
ncbi:MAG TPA: DUF4129 domain-containing protein [Pyrinomonadaceae bacterium]|nr:DUF4129 domain-containing protein [Pyrinomonadaceae bacterium]